MEPSYSVVADILSKFDSSSDGIKALWIVAVAVTLAGPAFCLLRAVREIAAMVLARRDRPSWQGHPVFALYRGHDGRWMLYARGRVRELDGGAPPGIDGLLPPKLH